MSVTMNLKKQVDTPVWEWTRFAPATTTSISCTTCGDLPKDSRYMYYIVSSAFYRYDTWTDTWMQLASPNTTPLAFTSMKYSSFGGFRGRILGVSGSTQMLLPSLMGDVLSGETIRIYSGAGANQSRTIIDVQDPIEFEQGLATATTNANQIQDTTKKWKFNQWTGYQVRLIYGLGATQVRKVIYNDQQTLYFYDVNYQQIDSWNNTPFSAIAPYAVPGSTAGSQTTYLIEAGWCTVDSGWTVSPDTYSRFTTQSGGIWLFSQIASGAFYSLQYYDIASDTWFTKSTVAGLIAAAPGTDVAIERISNKGGTYVSSIATSGTTRTLVDTNLSGVTSSLVIDRFVNYQIRIMSGTGLGQRRRIVGHNLNTIWVNRKWDIVPDNTSTYEIWDDVFMMYIGGMASSTLYNYHIEADLMTQGSVSDYGLVRNMAIRLNGWEDIGITSAVRNTNGILTINTTPVAGGSNHAVGDIVTLGTGTNGKVYIESVDGNGSATLVSLIACGSGYSVATASQSATTGSGTGLQISITSRTTVGRITASINHNIKIGDSITFTGANDSSWNTTYTVLGVDSLTTLDVEITAAATAVIANTTTTSLMVDSAANWDSSEHIGKIVEITTSGPTPTSQIRRITANTQTTLTLQSAVSSLPVTATSRYIIHDPSMIGRDEQYKFNKSQKGNTGWATSGGTINLIDSSKSWNINQWRGYKLRVISGTGYNFNEITITGNTTTSLTFTSSIGYTPDTTTKYIILDSFGLCTSLGSGTVLNDTTKNWKVNQWAGKRVRITSGTGVSNEALITSNTSTQLTAASGMGSPTTDSTYTIIGIPARGAGIQLMHLYGTSDTSIRGRYIFFPRGGASTTADRLDIPTEVWEYGSFFSPQSETLSTGSMYTYDGDDIIYFTKDATGRVYSYDIRNNKISNAGTIPYGQGTAIIGNRMEIVQTEDGLKYLYIMRHSGTEMFRNLLWWQI
jgi:hypothetical protein